MTGGEDQVPGEMDEYHCVNACSCMPQNVYPHYGKGWGVVGDWEI